TFFLNYMVLIAFCNLVIIDYDATNVDLRLALCDDPTCTNRTLATVDSAGNTGVDTSLVLYAVGIPVISYYDLINGDLRLAVCDAPPCTNVLANPGFEDPLSAWSTSPGVRRFTTGQAFEGGAVLLVTPSGGQQTATQTINVNGSAGDLLTLTFYAGGRNADTTGTLGARIELQSGGSLVNSTDCQYALPNVTFNWTPFTCLISASQAYDEVRVTAGTQDIGGGFIGFDSVFLTRD
ncbi:MAG: hypothetical protein ACFB51_11500, partial [Anaerolineae bacterium]